LNPNSRKLEDIIDQNERSYNPLRFQLGSHLSLENGDNFNRIRFETKELSEGMQMDIENEGGIEICNSSLGKMINQPLLISKSPAKAHQED